MKEEAIQEAWTKGDRETIIKRARDSGRHK
jgi:hypothetical protein